MVWDLAGGSSKDGTKVRYFSLTLRKLQLNSGVVFQVELWKEAPPHRPWRIWNLLPVKIEGTSTPSELLSETLGSEVPPLYDGDATGQSSARTQHAESERDDFGTIVTEVTVSTITTQKRYRVEDA
jgi:hypothetical protein